MSLTGCLGLLVCEEFSQCYYNVDNLNFCLWTDGSLMTSEAANRACQDRNNSFLPRITNSGVQSKLREFRSATGNLLSNDSFWIDVHVANIDSFHWINGSSLAG